MTKRKDYTIRAESLRRLMPHARSAGRAYVVIAPDGARVAVVETHTQARELIDALAADGRKERSA